MNESVENSVQAARNAPSPAASAGSRRFFRIHADWSLDTDGDGSPDWAEFEMAGLANHLFHAIADPFAADADANGTADGNQMDLDEDGTPDGVDIAVGDQTVNQPLGSELRYALFPVSATGQLEQPPLQINDHGTVLYNNGTWNAGKVDILKKDNGNEGGGEDEGSELIQCVARGINDSDMGGVDEHSAEQNMVLGKIPNNVDDAKIRLFLVGKWMGLKGWANRPARTCWVQADPVLREVGTIDDVIENISHELGHIFVDYGHPDEFDKGHAPLPETTHTKRLMVSGPAPGPFGKLLVKGEWNEAERWLKQNIDTQP